MTDTKIGLIGTGIMGEPMARNLLRAGYRVCVFNRTKSKADSLIADGAVWKDSPGDIAAEVAGETGLPGVVISVVSDSPDVEAVFLGSDGVCESLRQSRLAGHDRTLCIDMSTISPQVARRVAREVAKQGGAFLDAPVSGGRTGAEAGTLSIMVGGEEADVERARPIFEVLGKSLVHCGPVGNGQLTKLCNQILCGMNLLGVCEAIAFAQRAGLDPRTMLEAVSTGAAGSWALDNLGKRMLDRDFAPMFMIDLQQKDLWITLSTAREQQLPLPGTALVSQLLMANQAAGEGREGTQGLLKVLERLAQLPESQAVKQ